MNHNQYELRTGTKFVIEGSSQFKCATIKSSPETTAVAANVKVLIF